MEWLILSENEISSVVRPKNGCNVKAGTKSFTSNSRTIQRNTEMTCSGGWAGEKYSHCNSVGRLKNSHSSSK